MNGPVERSPCRIVFTHVPKVAGTTIVRRLVSANFDDDDIRQFRGVRDLTLTTHDFGVLVGHSVYGIHHFIGGDVRYFTMLREPIDRAVSHYFFIQQPPQHGKKGGNPAQRELHNTVALRDIFARTSHRRFRLMGTWLIDNMQTRYIAGWPHYWRTSTSKTLLETAKKNLRSRYVVFGLQDQFEDSLSAIAGAFDWNIGPDDGRLAKSTRVEKVVDSDDLEALKTWNELDLELFDYAQELFRKRRLGLV